MSNPATLPPNEGRYSHVVRVSAPKNFVFIAGQTARTPSNVHDKAGEIVGKDDFVKQAEQVFKNLEAALVSENLTFDNVVKVTVYLTDMKYRAQLSEVRVKYLKGDQPTSTLVEVAALAHPDYMLEIDAIAASD